MDLYLSKLIDVAAFTVCKLYLNKVDFVKGIRIHLGSSYPFTSRDPDVRKPSVSTRGTQRTLLARGPGLLRVS